MEVMKLTDEMQSSSTLVALGTETLAILGIIDDAQSALILGERAERVADRAMQLHELGAGIADDSIRTGRTGRAARTASP